MSTVEIPAAVSRLPDADRLAAPADLVRAARRARELAAHRGTPLNLSENGPVIEHPKKASPHTQSRGVYWPTLLLWKSHQNHDRDR